MEMEQFGLVISPNDYICSSAELLLLSAWSMNAC